MEGKFIAILVGIIAIAGASIWGYHAIYSAGDKAGAARIQVAWDTDKAQIQAQAAAAVDRANQERDAALETNEGIQHDLQAQLLAAHALNDQLASGLREYQARAATGGSHVPQARGGQAIAAAAPNASLAALDDAIAGALSECAANRANQSALIAEITPQL